MVEWNKPAKNISSVLNETKFDEIILDKGDEID